MAYTASQRNPFMLMMNPEVVLAAIEKSEHLGQLNSHMCRPLDRILNTHLHSDQCGGNEGRDGSRLCGSRFRDKFPDLRNTLRFIGAGSPRLQL